MLFKTQKNINAKDNSEFKEKLKIYFLKNGLIGVNPGRKTTGSRSFLQAEQQLLGRLGILIKNGNTYFNKDHGWQFNEERIEFKSGKFSFMGNGRAKTVFSSSGFVKIIVDAKTDRILGVHIIGPSAGDLIHEVCVAMEFGASSEDLARTCHAHPTFSEAVREAALACGDGAIHA